MISQVHAKKESAT